MFIAQSFLTHSFLLGPFPILEDSWGERSPWGRLVWKSWWTRASENETVSGEHWGWGNMEERRWVSWLAQSQGEACSKVSRKRNLGLRWNVDFTWWQCLGLLPVLMPLREEMVWSQKTELQLPFRGQWKGKPFILVPREPVRGQVKKGPETVSNQCGLFLSQWGYSCWSSQAELSLQLPQVQVRQVIAQAVLLNLVASLLLPPADGYLWGQEEGVRMAWDLRDEGGQSHRCLVPCVCVSTFFYFIFSQACLVLLSLSLLSSLQLCFSTLFSDTPSYPLLPSLHTGTLYLTKV